MFISNDENLRKRGLREGRGYRVNLSIILKMGLKTSHRICQPAWINKIQYEAEKK